MNPRPARLDALVASQPTWYEAVHRDPKYAVTILERIVDEDGGTVKLSSRGCNVRQLASAGTCVGHRVK